MNVSSAGNAAGTGGGENRIKSAAAALLKGGTLVGEPCLVCKGVQIKAAGKITCINCGNETELSAPDQQQLQKQQAAPQKEPAASNDAATASTSLASSAAIIEAKIAALASEVAGEQDTAIQKQKSDLLETYLRILEKMRGLARQQQ